MTNELIELILTDSQERMEKSVESLHADLRKIRTGRATPALVEDIPITYFGMPTPLKQLAVIGVPEPRLITIRPFSQGDIGEIEKGILRSELGITPTNDGKIIRLAIPPLTEERRRDLVKVVKNRVEEARVAVRNIRRDANKDLETAEKDKEISEDEYHGARDEVQELVNATIERIDQIGDEKESEIMEI